MFKFFCILTGVYVILTVLFSLKFSIKKYYWCYIAATILYLPAALYISQFYDHEISEDPNMWGVFGDYIGGVYNVLSTLLVAYISYRMTKFQMVGEKTAQAAVDIQSQIKTIQKNNFHHKSIEKLLRLIRNNETCLDDLLKNNLIQLADNYTEARCNQTPVNKVLEKAVINKLKSLSNG